jgi:hypothetical protein
MVDFSEIEVVMEPSVGFASIYLNEKWGPVCGMGKPDADAFCRQLSYTSAISVEERNLTYVPVMCAVLVQWSTCHL